MSESSIMWTRVLVKLDPFIKIAFMDGRGTSGAKPIINLFMFINIFKLIIKPISF